MVFGEWLRGQSLRASESVPANMTEGFYAQYSTEYLQSLFRCRREGREVAGHIQYGVDAEQLPAAAGQEILGGYEDALYQLQRLIASVERKIATQGKARPGAPRVKEAGVPYLVAEPLCDADVCLPVGAREQE